MIAILILLLGLAFIYAGKVETIVFDKKVRRIQRVEERTGKTENHSGVQK